MQIRKSLKKCHLKEKYKCTMIAVNLWWNWQSYSFIFILYLQYVMKWEVGSNSKQYIKTFELNCPSTSSNKIKDNSKVVQNCFCSASQDLKLVEKSRIVIFVIAEREFK